MNAGGSATVLQHKTTGHVAATSLLCQVALGLLVVHYSRPA